MSNTNVPSGSGSSIVNVPNGSGASISNVGTATKISAGTWTNVPSGFLPGGPTFSTAPQLSYGAQNFDGSNNTTMVDGQAISTWVNAGTQGSSANATQSTGINQPAFRLIAVPGSIANLSAAECVDVNRFVRATVTAIPQPFTVACLVRGTKAATQVYLSTGLGPVNEFYTTTGAGTDHVQCGTDVDTLMTSSANQFHSRIIVANGASSFIRIDGVQSGALSVGAQSFGPTVTLMRDSSSLGLIGFAVEFQVWAGTPGSGAPTAASIESAYASYYGGAFPQ